MARARNEAGLVHLGSGVIHSAAYFTSASASVDVTAHSGAPVDGSWLLTGCPGDLVRGSVAEVIAFRRIAGSPRIGKTALVTGRCGGPGGLGPEAVPGVQVVVHGPGFDDLAVADVEQVQGVEV